MDEIDKKLMLSLEKDARVSLKNLAKDLNVKTSTIYHRLHKLREANILEQFTVIINPKAIGLAMFYFVNVKLKSLVIGSLDAMFLESFAKYMGETYEPIVFSAVGEDGLIHLITAFKDEADFTAFRNEVEGNPYVERVDVVKFHDPVKGRKIFAFPKNVTLEAQQGELFDEEEDDLAITEGTDGIDFSY